MTLERKETSCIAIAIPPRRFSPCATLKLNISPVFKLSPLANIEFSGLQTMYLSPTIDVDISSLHLSPIIGGMKSGMSPPMMKLSPTITNFTGKLSPTIASFGDLKMQSKTQSFVPVESKTQQQQSFVPVESKIQQQSYVPVDSSIQFVQQSFVPVESKMQQQSFVQSFVPFESKTQSFVQQSYVPIESKTQFALSPTLANNFTFNEVKQDVMNVQLRLSDVGQDLFTFEFDEDLSRKPEQLVHQPITHLVQTFGQNLPAKGTKRKAVGDLNQNSLKKPNVAKRKRRKKKNPKPLEERKVQDMSSYMKAWRQRKKDEINELSESEREKAILEQRKRVKIRVKKCRYRKKLVKKGLSPEEIKVQLDAYVKSLS